MIKAATLPEVPQDARSKFKFQERQFQSSRNSSSVSSQTPATSQGEE
jgi:hypothetical protein